MSAESKWFEEDGRPRYGALTQDEWYEQVRLEFVGHARCEANMDAEIERLRTLASARYLDLDAEVVRLQEERDEVRAVSDRQAAEVERLRAELKAAKAGGTLFFENERLRAALAMEEHDCSPVEHPLCYEIERLRADKEWLLRRSGRTEVEVEELREEKRSMDLLVQRLRAEMDEIRGSEAELFLETERLRAELSGCGQDRFENERLRAALEGRPDPTRAHVHGFSADPPCCRTTSEDE